jgi:hypothetical protein
MCMLKKYLSSALYVMVALFVLAVPSYALTLDSIGALELGGAEYSEWWYTGTSPTLRGTADASSTVTLNIDGEDKQASADGDGAWAYWLDGEAKDYAMIISQGGDSYTFTLHLGQSFPGTTEGETTESTAPVPNTGINQIIAISFGLGVVLLASYLYLWGDSSKKVVFEKRFLRED